MEQVIEMASDILLGSGAFGAAIYCGVLARRLKRFNTLETGVGGAVAVLSAQVDDMTRTLDAARRAAGESSRTLTDLTARAEVASRKLELMMASLHDLPETLGSAGTPSSTGREPGQDEEWEAVAATAMQDPETPMFSTRRGAARGAAR